jgi:hypothetical protein
VLSACVGECWEQTRACTKSVKWFKLEAKPPSVIGQPSLIARPLNQPFVQDKDWPSRSPDLQAPGSILLSIPSDITTKEPEYEAWPLFEENPISAHHCNLWIKAEIIYRSSQQHECCAQQLFQLDQLAGFLYSPVDLSSADLNRRRSINQHKGKEQIKGVSYFVKRSVGLLRM